MRTLQHIKNKLQYNSTYAYPLSGKDIKTIVDTIESATPAFNYLSGIKNRKIFNQDTGLCLSGENIKDLIITIELLNAEHCNNTISSLSIIKNKKGYNSKNDLILTGKDVKIIIDAIEDAIIDNCAVEVPQGILTKSIDSSGGGADFYTYTITDMTINGGDAIDMNDIALDATCVGDIQAALIGAGLLTASVMYFAGENAPPLNSFDIAISIAQVPDDTTVSFNLIRTGFFDPTPTPELYELTMYSTRVSWTATFTTAEPENASLGHASMISGNRFASLDQLDTTSVASWDALLTACNDFGYTIASVVKDSPTQTTVTVEDSLTAISEFWITDAANIPIQQSVVTTPL